MQLLYALQSIRNPFLDAVFGVITRFGEETVFTIVGMLILWCINKKWGFRMLITGLVGSVLNQLLKAIFLIPRPWVLDPNFAIVESAREAASGYSFPSGHTQSAVTVFGMLAAWIKRRGVVIACIVMALLVGFSRMYLGVHTPLDVSVSLVTGVLTVVGMLWLFERCKDDSAKKKLGMGALAFALLVVLYVTFAPKRAANVPEFDAHGVENTWKMLGTLAGVLLSYVIDRKWLHFDTKAVWWAQAIKLVAGLALVMAVRYGAKPVLTMILGDTGFAGGLRYFLLTLAGGALWPMTFPFFAKLGQKK